jgi:hypothetical protein
MLFSALMHLLETGENHIGCAAA